MAEDVETEMQFHDRIEDLMNQEEVLITDHIMVVKRDADLILEEQDLIDLRDKDVDYELDD
jgi:hypothetical protein